MKYVHSLFDGCTHSSLNLSFVLPPPNHSFGVLIYISYLHGHISSVTYKLQVIALVNMLNMVRMMASLGFVVAFLTKGYLHKYWLPDVTLYFSPNQWMSMCDFRVCSSITVFECTHLFGVLWYLE
jgi:hypothetical protein